MRSSRHTSRRFTAVLATGVLVVAACGGGDDGAVEDVGDSGSSVTAPSTTLEPAPDDVAPTDPPATEAPSVDSNAGDEPDEPDAPDAPDATDVPTAASDVAEILQFTAPVVGGGEIDLAAYGDRPLLLWFWAPF